MRASIQQAQRASESVSYAAASEKSQIADQMRLLQEKEREVSILFLSTGPLKHLQIATERLVVLRDREALQSERSMLASARECTLVIIVPYSTINSLPIAGNARGTSSSPIRYGSACFAPTHRLAHRMSHICIILTHHITQSVSERGSIIEDQGPMHVGALSHAKNGRGLERIHRKVKHWSAQLGPNIQPH